MGTQSVRVRGVKWRPPAQQLETQHAQAPPVRRLHIQRSAAAPAAAARAWLPGGRSQQLGRGVVRRRARTQPVSSLHLGEPEVLPPPHSPLRAEWEVIVSPASDERTPPRKEHGVIVRRHRQVNVAVAVHEKVLRPEVAVRDAQLVQVP